MIIRLMMKNVVFILLFLSGLPGLIQAQGQERMGEQIEAFKIAFFTQKLNLTSQEAEVFWPVYNEYSSELDDLRRKRNQLQQEVKREILSSDNQKLEALSDQFIALKKEENNISEKYHQKFKQVLPIRKVIMLYKAEQEFKQELLKEIQRRRQERMKSGRPGVRN